MEDSTSHGSVNKLDDSLAIEIAGKITVIAIIVLFLLAVFILFLHVYNRRYWRRHNRHNRRHLVFSPAQDQNRQGLDSSVLKSLPVIVFHTQSHKEGLECAVCLSELVDGEKARMLPKCSHGFHVDCIDMWFQSHSTCPLCRNSVIDVSETPAASDLSTNVLFCGDGEGTSSSSGSSSGNRPDGMLVIDIPRQTAAEIFSPRSPVDQETKTPVSSRWRSLKRILSMDTRNKDACTCTCGSSSNSVDVEQGRS